MKELAVSLMVGFLKSFLERVAQNLWDAVWAELIQAAAEAEQKWKESGQGEVKREWVIEKILEYINSQTKLSWLYKKLISMALGMIVDSMVKAFNDLK